MLAGQNRTRCVGRVRLGVWLLSFIFVLAWAGTIQAKWISDFPSEPGLLESPTNPVISNWFLSVGYDGEGNFSVSSLYPGVAVLNNFSDPIYDIGPDSTLNIALSIDPQTGAPRGGTLTVTGEASSYYTSKSSGNLLTGRITQFGFADPTDAANSAGAENFQFLFKTTGGDLAPFFPCIAVNLNFAQIDFNGIFGNTPFFTNSSTAGSDTFAGSFYATPVPEPSAFLLAAVGIFGLAASRSLRNSRSRA